MRTKFTYTLLPDSNPIYSPILYRLFYLWGISTTDDDVKKQYEIGYSFVDVLLSVICDYNRCFYKLAKEGELFTAYPLIRLQADNLRYLVAEYLYPDKILPAIYGRGRELNQIEIDGKQLKQSDINDKVEALFEGYKRVWKSYSRYVHPSQLHAYYNAINSDLPKEIKHAQRTIKRTPAERDMIFINQCIVDTLMMILERYTELLKSDSEKWKIYLSLEKMMKI